MKLVLAFVFLMGLSSSVIAADEPECKDGYKKYSCEDVMKSERESFCWLESRKISDKKITRICKTPKRKTKNKLKK